MYKILKHHLVIAVMIAITLLSSLTAASAVRFSVSPSYLRWAWDDTSPKTIHVTAPSNSTWLVQVQDELLFSISQSSPRGSGTVTITPTSRNTSSAPRTRTISIMDGITPYTVTLTQEGCPPGTGDDAPGDVGDDSFIIPASGNNYICTTTFTSQDGVRSYSDVTYYDGLGYAVQENMIGAGGTGKSIITPIVYDNMRRADAVAYLPYAASSVTGSFIQTSSAISAQATFFRNTFGDNHAYAVNEYEPWTGGKLISSRKPGDAWVNGDHRSSYNRRSNTSSDAVRKITQSPGSNSTVTTSGYHSAGSLIVDIVSDEEGDETIVFTDASGKKICTRQHDGHDSADTYYVYDIRDNLVCVIQPEGAASLSSSSTISFTSDIAQKWFFTWKYDAWGNVTEYHVPGGGTTTYAYDSRNRLISEKTPMLSDLGATRVMTYDDCDRPTSEKYRRDSDGRVVQTHSWTYYPFGSSAPAGSRGLLQSETVWEIPQTMSVNQNSLVYCTRNYSYDSEGRVTGISESWSDGWTSNVSTTYDFVGNVTSVIESHSGPGGYSQTISTSYTYDQRGRKLTSSRSVSGTDTGNMTLATVTYSYDELGRPSGKTVTGSNGSTLVYEDFDLDIHGWTNSIIAKDNVNRTFFRENLAYTNPPTPISVARYDGNISESSYFHFSYPDDTPAILNSFYSYSYDGMKRLVDAKHSNVSVFDNDLYTERHIMYDRNGNITSLIRYNSDGGWEPLSFSHTGNRMTSVNGYTYSYDSAGNMTHDGRKGLDISYNCLNLPSHAVTADGSSLTYTYLADGTKMLVTNSGRGLRYKGSFTFSVAGANNFALESIACDDGRYSLVGDDSSSTTLKDLFFVTDHLGNVRSIADVSPGLTAPVILEQNDYLPFGTKVQNSSYASITENRYRYAGKEEQNIGGANLSLLDFGARYYDPYAARWTSVDPMADKYLGVSPYIYCNNTPLNSVDIDGKDGVYITFPDYVIKVNNKQYSNLGHAGVLLINNKNGNATYYEYGRYDEDNLGIVKSQNYGKVKFNKDGSPSEQSLNKVLVKISNKHGHGGRIEGAYVHSEEFNTMSNYAENRKSANNDPNRKKYNILTNNCGTFALDVIASDKDVNKRIPLIIDPRPVSIVKELQKKFEKISIKNDN